MAPPANPRGLLTAFRGSVARSNPSCPTSGWLTQDHPDPYGEQLVTFADQIAYERSLCTGSYADLAMRGAIFFGCCGLGEGCCCFVPFCGQQCGKTANQFPQGEFSVFYDWVSATAPLTARRQPLWESTAPLSTPGTPRLAPSAGLAAPQGFARPPHGRRGEVLQGGSADDGRVVCPPPRDHVRAERAADALAEGRQGRSAC